MNYNFIKFNYDLIT